MLAAQKCFIFHFLKKKLMSFFFKKTRSNVFLIILRICLRIRTAYQIAGKYNKTPFKSSKKYSLRIMILLKWVEKNPIRITITQNKKKNSLMITKKPCIVCYKPFKVVLFFTFI